MLSALVGEDRPDDRSFVGRIEISGRIRQWQRQLLREHGGVGAGGSERIEAADN
jgi:hypothetical protein